MTTEVSRELDDLLQQLNSLGNTASDDVLYHLIEDTSTICLEGVNLETADLIVSIVLREDVSILSFLRKISSNNSLKRANQAALALLCGIVRKYDTRLKDAANRIKTICLQVYGKSTAAAILCQSLETLAELLKISALKGSWDDLQDVAKRFLPDVAKSDTQVKPTVKREILILLGVLCVTSPSSLNQLSDSIAEKVISILKYQMTKAKSPEMSIIAGCFYSLTHILCHFDRAAFPEQVTTIFNCLAKAIDPSIKTTRFDVPKGALELLAKRGEQFRGQLLSGYKDIYARLLEFSRSKNNEVRKATASAIETFLRQVGLELVDPMDETVSEERRTEIFNYFLKDFMALMRANDSTLGSVSRAIRSYGYFAAAFRKFQGEEKVRDMLVLLLEKCFQVCVTDEETSESKGAFLPSFLQSLASIIKETTMVDESVAEPLKVIFVFTLEFYPKLTGALQESCSYAIGQFLYTVAAIKQRPVKLVSELLYQLLLQSCMHAPVVEGERAASYTEGTEVVSYKSFTSLWIHILTLSQEQKRRIGITGISDLKSYIYGETIEALLHMCKKLQLTINLEQDETDEDLPKSDSGKKNETVKVKDFQHLINLADFMKTVLEETETSYFNQWAYVFCHTIIRLSYQNPVVSSLYRLLTSAMTICNANDYFDKPITEEEGDTMDILSESSGAAVSATTQLISKYHRKVVISMKQYKDELLISCLKFIFSLPKCILQTNAEATAEALQIGLSLGLSYPPLIGECLPILRLMPSILREDDLVKQLKVLLPYLDKFLQHTDHVEQGKGEETPKVLKNKQRLRLPPSLLRMAHQKTQSERTEVQRLKLEVLKFLGELGGDRNRYMIDTDRRSQAKLAVSWDTNSHLLFDLPFQEMKVEIYLDAFLPRACELARTSSNRQTKVAACELVHSLAILLLGRSVPQDDAIEKLKSTDKLYQKLFPVILNLAVDVEQVTKQLFEPLMVQLIHWFTRFPKRKETSLLLDTLMDGVETMNNSALREFSAKCIAEFLRWSIKQTSVEQQKKNPENVKQLLRQMYSMARHPSSSRRLGACNVYNHIYRILREEESLVDQFTMEILVCFMECLALAHGDDSSLGTQKEAQKCLEHVERILKTKSAIFNLPSKRRRIPLGWTNATLKEAVLWLLERVGRHETECRHACMRLIVSLTTALPQELNTKRKLMEHVIAKNGVQYIKDRCEAVPLHKDRCVGLVQLSQDIRLSSAVTLKSLTRWFESILASLDSYCWLIGNDMISASTLFTGKEEIFSILMHFVEKVAMKSLQETLEVDSEVNKKDLRVYTPVETDEYNRCKCTVTVRLLDFLTVLISKGKQVLGQSKLLTGEIWKMISLCIFEPVAVGFNMADIEVLSNLPEILKSLLQVILRFLDSKVAEDFYKTLMNLTGSLGSYDLGHMIATLDLNSTEEHLLSMTHLANGYQLLSDVKLLAKCFASDLTEFSSQLAEAVVKGSRISAIEPAGKHLLESVYGLALSIGLPDSLILNSLYSPDGRAVYACIDTVLHKHITMNSPNLVQLMLEKARLDPHQKASYVIGLLDYMSTSTYLLDKIKQTVVKKIWDGWADLRCWWSGDTANQTTVSYCLHILKKSFLIDTTIEKHPRYSLMIDLFKTTLSSKQTELSQKYDLLDMLPAFLKGSSEQRKSVRDAVQAYVDERFPISSREFPINSSGYHDYITMFKKILEAMVLSGDIELLKVVLSVLCREETHADEKLIQEYIDRFANRLRKLRSSNLLDALTLCFNMFINSSTYPNQTCRVAALTRCCLPILSRTDRATVIDFFKNILGDIKTLLQTRESKAIPEAFEVVIKDKICCYELIEFMYSGLLKDEVFSPSSILAKGWVSNDPTSAAKADAWKTMTKDLIRICKDCKNEDMRGETIHLDLRRKMQCFAFNALMAIITNTQVNPDFYRTFLFSGDAVKGITPLENICPEEPYDFEIELTQMPRKSKRLVSARELKEEGQEEGDTVVYMQSVADSSLTEDLAKYDFSYSQSFASSRQRQEEKEQEQLELLYPDKETIEASSAVISQGYVEYESDRLNEHECMASFISLLQHMYRNGITPSHADEGDELPGWMQWLKDKMDTATVPYNVKHFIARLILNTEKVFSPFAQHWLPSLVKYITSCCQELHYFAIDVIVMVIMWEETRPQRQQEEKAMLRSLTQHIMNHVHHDRKGVFKNNLDLLKNCLERWKSFMTVDTSTIASFLQSSEDKKVLTGVQLVGVVIANKIEPYNADRAGNIGKQAFYCLLAKSLMNRLLSVYSSTAEVLGLTFKYLSLLSDSNSHSFLTEYEKFVEKGLSSAKVPVHKLIVCLYGITRHYAPFSGRFLPKVLFEVKRLHGDLRQKAVEIIASGIAETDSPYEKLSAIDFPDLLMHRNAHIMESCLRVFRNILPKLTAEQTLSWLPKAVKCQAMGNAACRSLSHSIFMNIYSTYRNESPTDTVNQLVVSSQEQLLLALSDDLLDNRLVVQNYWSADNTISQQVLPRLCGVLKHMYSTHTESSFLSYATNLLLELTSRSTDFERPVFRNALSECNFTTYAINSTWSQRYSTLAPMFADGTMSQSASSLDVGLLRGTQATQQFTATQAVTGQKLFNWMTQSSLDASLSSSSSMTESSLLFTVGPKASSPAKSSLPNKIAVGQPKRSKDAVNKESNPELAALRRRFIKDQESSRIYFAKREARRKRMEEERRQASKNQRENQVTIYRQYRAGDLPDIQIKYSAVIAPLQALAQKDSAIARMLFLVVYKAILTHPDAERSMVGDVLALVGGILRTSSECHPPLIASLLDLLIDLSELDETSFDSAVVCDSSVQCKQQPSGVVALECRLACEETKTDGPKAKRRKTSTASTSTPFNEANALTWTDLARLHKSLGNYDMVHSIMSEKVNVHELTRQALEKESRHDYEAAADLYESVLQNEKLEELVELSLIDDGRLHCLEQLSSWEEMGETLLANLGGDVSSLWADTSKDYYLKAYMKCQTRRLMDWKSGRLSFLDFIDESCKVAEQRSILEINHSEELSLIFMAQKDFERAKQYHQLSCERFLLEWSSLSQLMVNARADSVQTLQRLTEMGEFLSFITALDTDASNVGAVRAKVDEWLARSPGDLYSTSCWDSIMANRIFFTHMLDNQLPTDQFIEDRLDMNLNLAAHAATSGNIGLASSLLRSTLKDKREFGACLRVQLKWSAAGVLIKQRMANAADASLSLRVEHSSAAVLNMDRFKDVEIDAAVKPNETLYYQWYSLKGRTWSCLLSSILESTDEERASCSQALEQLVNRSGTEQVVCKVSHLAQESIQKSIRSHVPSLVSKAHLDMVVFADSLLRHSEEASDRLVVELSGIKECLVTSCAKALTLGSAEASTWVPRLLQLIELYPDIVPLFVEKTKEVPSWMFISWVSQMVVLLDREQAFAVQHIVMDIAQLYPMAVIYPFKISCVSYTFNTAGAAEGQSRLFLSKLSEVLTKSCRHVDTFIRALEQLSQPEALFSDWLAEWKEMTGRPRVDTQLIEEKYREMYEAILSQGETSGDESLYEQEPTFANVNNYRKQFSKAFSDKVLKVAGTRGEKLCNGSMKAVQDSLCKIAGDMKKKCAKDKELSPPTLLKDYSSWLASFSAELLDYDMEIPGQYGRKTLHKPIPENHVKIAGFDEKVLVLESLRKPKRIIIRGNDAKDYKFLVKGGEDLRLDQRIQTISTNINSMLSNESSCRSLSLTTYRVIPMNTRLGLIEWMDNVVTLKDLLKDTRTNAETQTYEMIYKDYRRKNCSDSGSYIFIDNYAKLRSRDCQDWMLALLHKSPHHLLSRALKSMSRSVESYYMLREHCITSHAVLCVCHYLLGIGDRHLSNFMMDTTSGGIVGIDFGHAFGSATSLLPIPELVPFRLTKLFTDLMSPYGTHGLFGSTMVNVLRLLRDNRRQLLNLLDVFIKEPSLDWMHNAKKQTTKASFEDTLDGIERVGPSQEEDVDWYPKEKVKFAKLKLLGAHPRCITAEEVKLNPAIKKHQKMAVSHVMPDSSVNMDTRLLVEAQVRALIDQASDPNLLGRIWFGFEPLV